MHIFLKFKWIFRLEKNHVGERNVGEGKEFAIERASFQSSSTMKS